MNGNQKIDPRLALRPVSALILLAASISAHAQGAAPSGTLDPAFKSAPIQVTADDELSRTARQRYQADDYSQAAKIGAAALAAKPADHALRLMVANSLAWTGRYDAAIAQYERLQGTPHDASARIGIGNILRWRGMNDLAMPYFEQVLKSDPKNADALQAIQFAGRELRPGTTIKLGHTQDNQGTNRNELAMVHRQWLDGRAARIEIGAIGAHDSFNPVNGATTRAAPKEVNASFWSPQLPLSPKIELAVSQTGDSIRNRASPAPDVAFRTQVFGMVTLEPVRDQFGVRLGRVNWGRLAFNGGAMADGLSANRFGLYTNLETSLATFKARADHYSISDGNRIAEFDAQVSPSWQPLPGRVSWYTGAFARKADRADPRYWSPDSTLALGILGLKRGWYGDNYDVSASAQRGFKLNADSRNNWALNASARYWLGSDSAIGAEAFLIDSPRPASYRQRYVGATYQQLW